MDTDRFYEKITEVYKTQNEKLDKVHSVLTDLKVSIGRIESQDKHTRSEIDGIVSRMGLLEKDTTVSITDLKQHQNTQVKLNEDQKDRTKQMWQRFVAAMLALEIIGIGIGFWLGKGL